MFSGKDAANAAYPTQWALNPTAYQNIDSSQVDWAALAQQWIAMKESVPGPPAKPEIEEGEAPMEVENPDPTVDVPGGPDGEWSTSPNTWGNSWNQWGWGWPGAGPVDPKIAGDPTMAITPIIDGYPVPDGSAPMPGYTSGTVSGPTFQHGYWTAPPAEPNDRSGSRSRDRRSKSKNRESKVTRIRPQRDKPQMIPPVIEPIVMPTPMVTATIDAAKRRQLPAWIREGLEKMEREKQKAIEREEEKKARELAEIEQKKMEEEALERLKAEASGQPMLPAKSKFESESESEESQSEAEGGGGEGGGASERAQPSRGDLLQEVMTAVRRSLTEVLLEVTDQEILTVSQEELARYNNAQASRTNALKASRCKALASIASGLGLGAYESSEDSDEETNDLTDVQLQEIIKRKRLEFERTSREIEAEVRRAELKENAEGTASPVNVTPERPRTSRSSATPPPVDSETPEKIPEGRLSKEKRPNHKGADKVDGRKLDTIPEEKSKKSSKHDNTPSPQKSNKASKEGTNSSSSDSEDDSSSDGKSSSESEPELVKAERGRSKKRKRKSTSSSESRRKNKKLKKEKYKSSDKHHSRSKHQDEYEKQEKSKKRREEYYDKHKSRSRDYSHKDKYRDDSEEDRPRKRSKRSRSISYESRSGRRKSRDRSDDRSRRHKRSYDRDRSYDRYDKHDRYDRYERARDDRHETHSRHRR